jgi:hypothetical protein
MGTLERAIFTVGKWIYDTGQGMDLLESCDIGQFLTEWTKGNRALIGGTNHTLMVVVPITRACR